MGASMNIDEHRLETEDGKGGFGHFVLFCLACLAWFALVWLGFGCVLEMNFESGIVLRSFLNDYGTRNLLHGTC
jgi:hypothetical protein